MFNLVSENQGAYVNNRFISEDERLTLDNLEIIDSLPIDGLFMTIDIEKVFDSVNPFFLISVLRWYGFEDDFIKLIKTLLKNEERCASNGGNITRCFKLERGTREGDPISAYLFIIVLGIAFTLIKTNSNNKGLSILTSYILRYNFFYIKNINQKS